MRGGKPKDLALKMLQGNPGRRALSLANPFVVGTPEKPAPLDQDASEEWDRLTSLLHGLLTKSDRGVLFCCCDAYAQLMQATRTIRTHGSTYTTTNDNGSILIRQRPEVRHRESARRAYQLALTELGCSPTSHSGVRKLPTAPASKLSGLRRLLG